MNMIMILYHIHKKEELSIYLKGFGTILSTNSVDQSTTIGYKLIPLFQLTCI